VLRVTLEPFNDIEHVASLLGIPFEAAVPSTPSAKAAATDTSSLSNAYAASNTPAGSLDPRSPEFKDILNRLAKAAIYLKTHHDIMDSERYEIWLEKLENRASSLVGRAMREIVATASKQCLEIYEQKRYQNASRLIADDAPIESAPLYQKFRGLSYRLRELSALLLRGSFAEALALNVRNSGQGGAHYSSKSARGGKRPKYLPATGLKLQLPEAELDVAVLTEVRQGYVQLRNELLLPFLKDAWLSSLQASSAASGAASGAASTLSSGIDLIKVLEESKALVRVANTAVAPGGTAPPHTAPISLCAGIRQAFSTLLRVTQLELQLFDSLFVLPPPTAAAAGDMSPATVGADSARSPRMGQGTPAMTPGRWCAELL
jgi:hypothetical protein